jgi:hypothetical protein
MADETTKRGLISYSGRPNYCWDLWKTILIQSVKITPHEVSYKLCVYIQLKVHLTKQGAQGRSDNAAQISHHTDLPLL